MKADRPVINYFLKGTLPKDVTVARALPLPHEERTYESWAKLNSKAKHTGGTVNSPWAPAQTDQRTAISGAGDDLLADAEAGQQLRQQVERVFGPAGVRALQRAGTL
jgi:hypothetical protein